TQGSDSDHTALAFLLPSQARLGLGKGLSLKQRFPTDRTDGSGIPGSFRRGLQILPRARRRARVDFAPVFGLVLFQQRHLNDALALWAGRLLAGQLGADRNLCIAVVAVELDAFRRRSGRGGSRVLGQGSSCKLLYIDRMRNRGRNCQSLFTSR